MSPTSKIDALEALLNSEEDTPIQILPNGEIREIGKVGSSDMGNKKPLTMRENPMVVNTLKKTSMNRLSTIEFSLPESPKTCSRLLVVPMYANHWFGSRCTNVLKLLDGSTGCPLSTQS